MIRKGTIASVALTVVLSAGLTFANPSASTTGKDVTQQIHHEIVTLPYTGIWDWIEAELHPDGTVVLTGDVTTPLTKSDLESRLRHIESVTNIVDDIRVLPLSQFDNQIRAGVYRSLFNFNSTLSKYAMGANPSIHIIVANGKVTLKGVVSNAMDKTLAGMAANRVSGIFSVDNELQVEANS
jgi:hyperosmotically inducible periplasmic protein